MRGLVLSAPASVQAPYGVPMATKTQRIEMRADEEQERLIAAAAEMSKVSVSAFVLRAASAEATRVLARAESVVMPAEQFDALIASLDTPDPAPRLRAAAARAAGSV